MTLPVQVVLPHLPVVVATRRARLVQIRQARPKTAHRLLPLIFRQGALLRFHLQPLQQVKLNDVAHGKVA